MNYEKIKLLGGAEVTVDFDGYRTLCKKCGKPIRFAITKNGKSMPIIQINNNWQAHFTDCPAAASFRKPRIQEKIDDEERNQNLLSEL